jgi:hypothetical protein
MPKPDAAASIALAPYISYRSTAPGKIRDFPAAAA